MHSDFPGSGSNQVWYVSHLVSGKLEELCMKWRRKPFCQAPLKGRELIGACWIFFFLLSNSLERTFCFMCILTLYSTLESALILICLQSVRVEIGCLKCIRQRSECDLSELPPLHFKMAPPKRQVCAKLWPEGTCCPWVTNTRLALIDCLVFYLWCGSN